MSKIDKLAVNTIRVLSAEAIQKANSGHPGLPLGSAPMAYTLWSKYLKHNPKDPKWENRDRFILSAGHASMLLYSLLHMFGYQVSMEDIKKLPPVGIGNAGPPGIWPDGRRGSDLRPARPGHRDGGRLRDGGSAPCGGIQQAGL